MEDIYDQFVSKSLEGRVKAGKKMTKEQLLKLAGGRIWTGRQAKENGLIDELGGLDDAIAAAAKLGGLPGDKEPELLLLPKSAGFLDDLLGGRMDAQIKGLAPLVSKVPGLADKLRGVDGLLHLQGKGVWCVMPYRLELK
jgi:protease-4